MSAARIPPYGGLALSAAGGLAQLQDTQLVKTRSLVTTIRASSAQRHWKLIKTVAWMSRMHVAMVLPVSLKP